MKIYRTKTNRQTDMKIYRTKTNRQTRHMKIYRTKTTDRHEDTQTQTDT